MEGILTLKEEFSKTIYPSGRKEIAYILQGAERKEIQFNKSLHDFNPAEIQSLLKSYNKVKSFNTHRLYANVLKSYLRYCILKGVIKENPLENLNISSWLREIFPQTDIEYFTDTALENLIARCKNAQDAVIIQLLFEGVWGKECNEILNLKVTDIKGNKLYLIDDQNTRELTVSDKCIDLIHKANEEKQYFQKNGKTNAKAKVVDLIPSEYVLKISNKGLKADIRDRHLIYRRISGLKEVLNIPIFNSGFIYKSGKFTLAKDTYLELGYVNELVALDRIQERFKKNRVRQELKQVTNPNTLSILFNIDFDEKINPYKLLDENLKNENEPEVIIKRRLQQATFRDKLLSSYSEKCCITGESLKEVLEAAHIQSYIGVAE